MSKKDNPIGFGAVESKKTQTRGPRRKKGEQMPRDGELVKGILEGKSVRRAALDAGFSEAMANKASARILTPQVKQAIEAEMERQGITDELLVRRIRRGLNAQTVKTATHEGAITDVRRFRDFEQIRRYTEISLELKGHLKRDGAKTEVNMPVTIISSVPRPQRPAINGANGNHQ